jgi:DNA invertase Pin-like site-specific DNA recombinase
LSNKRKIPSRLYKYRSFSNLTLDALISDQIFFADPSTFNDPLDTRPVLATDLEATALAEILGRLVEERVRAEMSAAAKTIKYRGPKTVNHIEVFSPKFLDPKGG